MQFVVYAASAPGGATAFSFDPITSSDGQEHHLVVHVPDELHPVLDARRDHTGERFLEWDGPLNQRERSNASDVATYAVGKLRGFRFKDDEIAADPEDQ